MRDVHTIVVTVEEFDTNFCVRSTKRSSQMTNRFDAIGSSIAETVHDCLGSPDYSISILKNALEWFHTESCNSYLNLTEEETEQLDKAIGALESLDKMIQIRLDGIAGATA